jgi:hypothetical protein
MSHDEPQPEYCDCDGFHDGSCRSREIKRLQDKLAVAESSQLPIPQEEGLAHLVKTKEH